MQSFSRAYMTKLVEGYNYEVSTHDGQYKFRNGSIAMRGADIARRHSLRSSIEKGVPAKMEQVGLEMFGELLLMEAADDLWFEEQSGIPTK